MCIAGVMSMCFDVDVYCWDDVMCVLGDVYVCCG